VKYIPVLEKRKVPEGVEWKGRILNLPGFKVTELDRDEIEEKIKLRLRKIREDEIKEVKENELRKKTQRSSSR
jgi:hypothetical protein